MDRRREPCSGQQCLCQLDAHALAAAVRAGHVSAEEVIGHHLARIESVRHLNALITTCVETALRGAGAVRGGPLAGVPVVVKDLVDTAGVRTTYGSKVFAGHVPSRTAPVVRRLEQAGAVVVGKANLHEFAWGLTSQNPHWGDVQNPTFPGRTPGGSSGGSAAAVAAGLCALALGTDTGGSIRIPSACCDVVGFKPSHGSLPMDGVFPLAPTLDTIGPIARSVRDCALAWAVLAGSSQPNPRIAGRRVGVAERSPYFELLEHLGARPVVAAPPAPPPELGAVFLFEARASHRATYPARRHDYGPDLAAKLDAAGSVTPAQYDSAMRELVRWRADNRAGDEADVYLLPVLGMDLPPHDVHEPDVRDRLGALARPANQLGWAGLAVGNVQIVGLDDVMVLEAGLALEGALTRSLRAPRW